ncbi:MAG: 6-phosphogluconolactonase, partial [Verrucomicrobia bacterium]|nr:6-phosphogluconolactonase [Verrucomicrobiota bacterium]
MKNVELIQCANAAALALKAAQRWLDLVEARTRLQTKFNVALSGGRIAGNFFSAVVEQARRGSSALAQVHFFWSDERCVAPTDAASNFLLASQNLLQPLV